MTAPSDGPDTGAHQPVTITLAPQQIEHLERTLTLTKALAAPGRLALAGALAAQPGAALTLDELAERVGLSPARLERDVHQLAEAGLIRVIEWQTVIPGREPVPLRLAWQPDYSTLLSAVIATLHQVLAPTRPTTPRPVRDDRAKTLARFLKGGRLVGWPAQQTRQRYLLEEIATAFAPDRRYSEAEVNAILKAIYAYDYVALRRDLIDHRLLRREGGVYWRVVAET